MKQFITAELDHSKWGILFAFSVVLPMLFFIGFSLKEKEAPVLLMNIINGYAMMWGYLIGFDMENRGRIFGHLPLTVSEMAKGQFVLTMILMETMFACGLIYLVVMSFLGQTFPLWRLVSAHGFMLMISFAYKAFYSLRLNRAFTHAMYLLGIGVIALGILKFKTLADNPFFAIVLNTAGGALIYLDYKVFLKHPFGEDIFEVSLKEMQKRQQTIIAGLAILALFGMLAFFLVEYIRR